MGKPLSTPPKMTREEYRRWAEAQSRGRYELVEGEIVAMAPERVAHLREGRRLARPAAGHRRRRCRLRGSC